MNKQYSAEEKSQLIVECKDWIVRGRSISSFCLAKSIPKGTMYGWVQAKAVVSKYTSAVRVSSGKEPKPRAVVHIPKKRIMKEALPESIEMRCGAVSFVFAGNSIQISIEAALLALKTCDLV
jgi:hypothetical protein